MGWKLVASKQFPMFSRLWTAQAFTEDMQDTLGMAFTKYKSMCSGVYADEDEFEKLSIYLTSELKNNPESIIDRCKNWRLDCQELLDYANAIKLELSKSENGTLLDLMEGAIKRLRKSRSYLQMPAVLENHVQDWLRKIVAKNEADESKASVYFHLLSSSTKSTRLADSQTDLERIVSIMQHQDNEKAEDLIREYTANYRWLGYETAIGEDLTEEDTKERLIRIARQKIPVSYAITKNDAINELNLNKEEIQMITIIDELIYLRSYLAECHMVAGSLLRPLFEEISRRINISYQDLVQLTFDEIKLVFNTQEVDFNEIVRRKHNFGLLTDKGKHTIFSGDQVEKIEEAEKIQIGVSEIKGQAVNPGIVSGTVKIILNKNDFAKIEPGDILVAKMTNPDFVMVLEKCGGIITDIGGITSHAATISRELGKPCITGTAYATKVLHDGQQVLLDANAGIIKIIKD